MNKIENPEIISYIYNQSILDKVLNQFNREKLALNNDAGTTGYPHADKCRWSPYLTPYIRNELKGIKGQNVKAKAIKILENMGMIFHTLGSWLVFLISVLSKCFDLSSCFFD